MSLKIGIVGLPNVGKSTLFNALVKGSKAEAANYPFCTIEPNVGIVEVPDERLKPLAEISKSEKIIPAVVEFVDIAGLVRGASKGEGLGNQFLAHIRECSAIAMVVRFFEDKNVTHIEEKLDPMSDIETIETELQLADLQTLEKRIASAEKDIKSGDRLSVIRIQGLKKLKQALDEGKNAREVELTDEENEHLKDLMLLTQKPILYVANCSEEQLVKFKEILRQAEDPSEARNNNQTDNGILITDYNFIPISAKVEAELNDLPDGDKAEYLESLGIKESGLHHLIKEAYKALGLMTYLTSGEKETRAWTIERGFTAPQAAGVIHTDFERGFIAADVVNYQDFVANNGWAGARAHGLVRTEGKSYLMKDGDICLFKFNV